MAKRKERILKELYNATVIIKEPEITPVLNGSYRMQGPVDETDCDYQTNTVSSRVNKGVSRHTNSKKIDVRADSGTCNFCSAPCSSCLHINQALMGLKHGESLDGTSRENACSVNDAVQTVKSGKYEIGQHTASETSNVISVNSSHDSFSENAESKANLRISDVSGASQDVEICQKLLSGRSVRESLHTSKPHKRDSDKSNLKNKFEDLKGLEGHDDNISCLSGANDTTKLSSSDSGTTETKTLATSSCLPNSLVSEEYCKAVQSQTDSCLEKTVVAGSQNKSMMQKCNEEHIQKVCPPISLSADFSSRNSGLMENPLFKDIGDGTGSESVQSEYSNPPNGKSISCNPSLKNLEVDSCSQLGGETSECSREYLNPSMAKEVVSKTFCGQKPASYNSGDFQDSKIGFVGGNFDSSVQDCPKLEAETENITINLPAEALNSVGQMKEFEKVRELLVLPDAKETSMQSHPVNESDESDIVEDDVKVCDICGDAGREDLLVVCCRCSDGAEHIYCTKGMLDKIPEGDWVCKDCELEERNNQAKDKLGPSDGNDPDVQGNKTDKDCSSVKISRKRNAEDADVSSAAKRQALEPTIGSPKASSPIKVGVLSRDSSFKNLDRGKVKPAQKFPHGNHAVNDTPETASPTLGTQQQTRRGAFLKSNSFSTANAKPKVKLVDEVVLQKQKSIREPASLDMKEGTNRVMGKSMSFKSVHSGRSLESKVKMLSPKFPNVPDLKGLKHTKDRIFVERKNSFKSERPLVSSTIASSTISSPRVDKKLAARGDTVSFSSISNNHELKAVPSDSKLTQSSRPVNQITHKGSEVPVPLGEGKRQLSLSASGVGKYTEQKPIHDRMKDNSSSNFLTDDRPICKISDSVPDGLPQSRESINVAEDVKESSNSCPRQSIAAGGKSVPCQKCKDIGHSAEFCTVDSPQQPLAPDIPTSSSSKEAMDKGNNRLKAAIEAAMLKKPGIYRKNRVPDQSDEVSVSSINCEVSLQDQLSNSSNPRKLVSGEEVNGLESAWNSNTDSTKQTTGTNVKQFTLSAEAVTSRSGNGRPILPADGKPFMMDMPSHASVATSAHLMMSAIPEHEYIWQGCFEVHRSGSLPELYDGFQAHLSTYASRRVLETMNKFPSKVFLNEVPRLSTWPIQLEETGAKDDHIALYFFARDHESYEKSYKTVLEGMMRNDLALKGNIDGVEILIFPSNRLPVKSQRWNAMFFLWGVFIGKRVNCLQQVPGSPKKFSSPRDIPTAIMSLSENVCSLVPINSAEPKYNRVCNVASDAHASMDLPWSSTETINGDTDTKVVSLSQNGKCAKLTMEQPENRLDCNLLPTFQTSSQHSRSTTSSLEGHVDSDCRVKTEPEASVQVTRSASGSNISDEKIPAHLDTTLDRRAAPQYFSTFLDGRQEFASLQSVAEENIPNMVGNDKDQLKLRNLKVEGLSEAEAAPEIGTMRVPSPKELNTWPLNHRKRSFFDSPSLNSEAVFAGLSQTVLWNGTSSMLVDEGSTSEKGKLDNSDLYGFTDHTSSSRDGSRIQDVASSSAIKKNRYDEGCEETAVGKTLGNAERYFFPVDPYPVTHVDLDNSSMPWKAVFLDNEEPLEERVPNLELALGAEMKPPMKQSLPPFLVAKVEKNVNQDQHPGRTAVKAEEDDVSAALSLSLSFPFPDRDQAVQPVAKSEQLLPERRRVNPSPLFGAFSDK